MQADVYPFIIHNMDLSLGLRALGIEVGGDDVVGFAGGDPEGELAPAVGNGLPLGLLLVGAPDLDLHAPRGTAVGRPDSAEDQGVGLLFLGWGGGGEQAGGQ